MIKDIDQKDFIYYQNLFKNDSDLDIMDNIFSYMVGYKEKSETSKFSEEQAFRYISKVLNNQDMTNICILNKKFYEKCGKYIKKTEENQRLWEIGYKWHYEEKYNVYNDSYKDSFKTGFADIYKTIPFDPEIHKPQLLDAVSSGITLESIPKTFKNSGPDEKEIKRMIKLWPKSVNCQMGESRTCTRVSVLAMACLTLSLEQIELLLKNGADPTAKILSNGSQEISILTFLSISGETESCRNKIKELFEKYTPKN